MTDCWAEQPQGRRSDSGRREERQRGGYGVIRLHGSFLLLDASSISFHDADYALTQGWPRLPQRNNPKWWLLLHFPLLPLSLSYLDSVTLSFICCLLPSLSPICCSLSTNTHPHTHVPPTAPPASTICLLWSLRPDDSTNRRLCVLLLLLCPLLSAAPAVEFSGQDRTTSWVVCLWYSFEELHRVFFFLSASQRTNFSSVHLSALMCTQNETKPWITRLR